MTIRILGLAALMAIFAGTSNKAMASDEAAPSVEMSDLAGLDVNNSEDPAAAPPRWNPRQPRGTFVCYARNVTGRTFGAWGNWRTPMWRVQSAALESCRRNSGFFRFSCRNIGCRRSWR